MPESPEVDQLEAEFPVPLPDVPTREGEDRFRAGMNLEDRRRKESIVEELKTQLKRLEGTATGEMATKFARSPSARRRQIAVRKEVERLQTLTFYRKDSARWEGPSAPATIINLNPVELKLQGELARWTVPAAGASAVGDILNLKFRGRTFPSSYMTFRSAHVWLAHTGTQNDTLAGIDTPAMEARHIPPLGLAHQFYSHYCEGAADAQYMGGIILFEGDIHTLDPARLKRSERRIYAPKQDITLDGLGDVVYTVEEMALDDCMARALTQQRKYADAMIAEGHRFATAQSDIERNQLSNYHRLWHNWALDRGYLPKAYPWAAERLQDSPLQQAVFCPDCRMRQADPEQHFCTNCNAPFDPLKAFLAGKSVSPDRLAMYEGAEWDAIVSETKRRKAKIAMLELPEEKPTKGKAKKDDES